MASKAALFSKEQRAEIERELSSPWGMVSIQADGHRLFATVVKLKGLRYGVAVYIDGFVKGEFMRPDSEIGRKFYRETKVSFIRAKKGELTKRQAAKLREKYSATVFSPYFPNARSMLAKLQRTVAVVEGLRVGREALDHGEVRVVA